MKKYYLRIVLGDLSHSRIIEADELYPTDRGYYVFYLKKEIVSYYPIDRTIIEKIETIG